MVFNSDILVFREHTNFMDMDSFTIFYYGGLND